MAQFRVKKTIQIVDSLTIVDKNHPFYWHFCWVQPVIFAVTVIFIHRKINEQQQRPWGIFLPVNKTITAIFTIYISQSFQFSIFLVSLLVLRVGIRFQHSPRIG